MPQTSASGCWRRSSTRLKYGAQSRLEEEAELGRDTSHTRARVVLLLASPVTCNHSFNSACSNPCLDIRHLC